MGFSGVFLRSAVIFGLVLPALAGAEDKIPVCPAYKRPLPVNNEQVLHWKRTTPNQFRERAHIKGLIVQVFPDRNGHEHFEIQIGKRAEDVIEVIYNQEFGALPENLKPGQTVEACGDYITSTDQAGPYPPSPSGAIIHWIHLNPKSSNHDPGFLVIDGTLFGQDIGNVRPRGPSRPDSFLPEEEDIWNYDNETAPELTDHRR